MKPQSETAAKAASLEKSDVAASLALLNELANIKFALDETAIVAITDVQGTINYVNDTFCEISKYNREELLGQNHRILNSGYHPTEFFKEMWAAIGRGETWQAEIKNKAKDGSFYWVDTTIVPFVDKETNKPYQYIAIRKDITYLKKVEEELRILNEGLEQRVKERTQALEKTVIQLQESERMREMFVSALTHDLRTPLVAEQRALDILEAQKHNMPEKIGPLLECLLRSNRDLLEMVNRLLEIYQYEAGRIRLLLEPVSVFALSENCVDKLLPLAQSKNITLLNNVSEKLPHVEADYQQLQRILVNLIGNAIENVQEGGRIQIDAREDNDFVTFVVSDNGPGIPPEVLPHLFDRYFLAQQNKKKIGSGLGLSICHLIADLHDGSIEVKSEPEQGTTFFVSIPKFKKQVQK